MLKGSWVFFNDPRKIGTARLGGFVLAKIEALYHQRLAKRLLYIYRVAQVMVVVRFPLNIQRACTFKPLCIQGAEFNGTYLL